MARLGDLGIAAQRRGAQLPTTSTSTVHTVQEREATSGAVSSCAATQIQYIPVLGTTSGRSVPKTTKIVLFRTHKTKTVLFRTQYQYSSYCTWSSAPIITGRALVASERATWWRPSSSSSWSSTLQQPSATG